MIRNKCIPLCTVFLCSLLLTGTLFARGGQEEAPAPPETDAATIQTEAPSPAQDAELLPMDPAVSSGRLANGLSFYLRQNSEPENRVFLRLVVNAGSILETEEELGIAHFVEHAAFLGTEAYDQDQIVRYLESIGMRFGPNVNAYTSFDETVYMLQIPADDPEKLERGIHILQQWASAVSFEPQRIETERGVIQEEWRVGLGASQRFLDKQFPILFKDSRYADRLPIGNPEVFMNATHEDLRDFYERWYRPDLMSVIAVGDFEPSEMEALITEYFGRIPAEKNPTERPLYPVAEHEETLFAPFSDPEAGNTWISIYNKQPPQPLRTKSEYRKQLEHRVFADIMNTRFEELSRRPDAPFMAAGAAHGSLVRTSYAAIMQAVTEENRIHDGFEALLTEAIRARTHGFSEAEVERGRRRLHRQMQSAYNERNNTPSSAYTTEYTRHFLEGEAIPGIEYEWELTRELLP
ncbi:MAG: M16 family metallopeptidase, partial [Spirochaeta sp.]